MNQTKPRRDQLLTPALASGSTVKVIGLGGVGGIVARYASVFLASLQQDARMVLIDGDHFEEGNSARMLFREAGNKARQVRDELRPFLGHTRLALLSIEEYVSAENIARLIRDDDYVILCVDNHATRKLVNDHCARLDNVSLLSGGNDGVGEDESGHVLRGTYGNVQVYLRREGQDQSPGLDRYHPEVREPADLHPEDAGCTELVASVPQILFANLMTASALCSTFLLLLSDALHYSEACFDLADCVMRPSPIPAPGAMSHSATGS